MAPDASTMASWAARASNLFGAVVKGSPTSAEMRLPCAVPVRVRSAGTTADEVMSASAAEDAASSCERGTSRDVSHHLQLTCRIIFS
jgi:hypothetical protein